VTFYDLLKRLPRDPAQQLEFGDPDFDLMMSVVSTEAALACAQGVGGSELLLWRMSDGLSDGSGRQGFESTFKACLGRAFTDTEVIASASLHQARNSCVDCRRSLPVLIVDAR
jgi:hypothetical protein